MGMARIKNNAGMILLDIIKGLFIRVFLFSVKGRRLSKFILGIRPMNMRRKVIIKVNVRRREVLDRASISFLFISIMRSINRVRVIIVGVFFIK